ncbi:MAG TPA: type II toxin-antitoxin system ParD family antitoxin [Vitreimonas sp.]|uniref:type II toxin-antitoxin system ParD family antitoxin n=1 Tax=Vitreimonas sp. TaxID=3069702 RepID=UPI002D537608|nr:type II toxin-antitoxin system ParD family antitoxin [Vitreimonas sp.]HYD87945.1 type II toxin-antitoxin system ParD family antitoxin [Vitreimonas sp.]
MNKPTTIVLPEHQISFVESQVAAGHYGSPSEAVQAALRLLEAQESKLEQLRQALIEGEESPLLDSFDPDEFLARMRTEHTARK